MNSPAGLPGPVGDRGDPGMTGEFGQEGDVGDPGPDGEDGLSVRMTESLQYHSFFSVFPHSILCVSLFRDILESLGGQVQKGRRGKPEWRHRKVQCICHFISFYISVSFTKQSQIQTSAVCAHTVCMCLSL